MQAVRHAKYFVSGKMFLPGTYYWRLCSMKTWSFVVKKEASKFNLRPHYSKAVDLKPD
jgi:hypothetical protein